jgi:IMP cyclohydrolase
MVDPSLIIYWPVRVSGDQVIVTNGDQTDTIYDFIRNGASFVKALRTREFEPDAPNFTPRVSAMATFADGDFRILAHTDTALLYERSNGQERILIAVNGGSQPTVLPMDICEKMTELFRLDPGYTLPTPQPEDGISVPAGGCVILLSRRKS